MIAEKLNFKYIYTTFPIRKPAYQAHQAGQASAANQAIQPAYNC
jgi:hypothetical protein